MHKSLLEIGIKLNYFDASDSRGICNGITMAWLSSCLTGNTDEYEQRIDYLFREGSNLPEQREKMWSKTAREKEPSEEEANLIQSLAFYEQLVLYQKPQAHRDLFNGATIQHDVERISEFAASENLGEGFSSVYSSTGIYTPEELTNYLSDISTLINEVGYTEGEVIGFQLKSHNHTIGLAYDTKSGSFKVMDINQGKSKEFDISDTKAAADMIFNGFSAPEIGSSPRENPEFMAFNLHSITTAKDDKSQLLQNKLNTLRITYPITEDLAQRQGVASLAFMAASNGDVYTLQKLAETHANLNTSYLGITPVQAAAIHGYGEAIDLLKDKVDFDAEAYDFADRGCTVLLNLMVKHGANLDNVTYKAAVEENYKVLGTFSDYIDGAAYIAAELGDNHALDILAEEGANLGKVAYEAAEKGNAQVLSVIADNPLNLERAAYMAAENENGDVLDFLAENSANLSAAAYMAAEKSNMKVLDFLTTHGANVNEASSIHIASLRFSVEGENSSIIQKMEDFIKLQLMNNDSEFISITPLLIASIKGDDQIINKLSEINGAHNADIGLDSSNECIEKSKDFKSRFNDALDSKCSQEVDVIEDLPNPLRPS